MTDVLGSELERLLAGLDLERWRDAVNEYLDRTDQPNVLFNILGREWLRAVVGPVQQPNLLQHTVGLVEQWDAAHDPDRRHKGTPYYFLGMGYILLGDIDRGFLYMHMAFREDQLSSGKPDPAQPAMRFVTLDATSDQQAFKDEVDEYAAFIEARMRRYRARTGCALTLPALRGKVIPEQSLWDDMFHLNYATARIRRLEAWGHVANTTPFGVNLLAQALGDLCLVAEEWMRYGWPLDAEFFQLAVKYLHDTGYKNTADASLRAVSKASKAQGAWGATVEGLLDGTFRDGIRALAPREADIALAYLIRNRAAHSVKADPILASRFEDIESRVYAAIFGIVEQLP
jgi:hypothetical protein